VDQARTILEEFRRENPDYHYEHRDVGRRKGGKEESGEVGGFGGEGQPDGVEVNGLLSIFASQMIAHFVLQNREVADGILASIRPVTLPKLLAGMRDPVALD
jgi:hypothetical protein